MLQNKVRDLILDQFPGLTTNDVKSTTMGESGPDVQLSERAYELFPFVIECKKYKKFSVYEHYEQCKKHNSKVQKERKDALVPTKSLLIIEGDYKDPLAIVDAKLFIGLAAFAMAFIQES